MAEITCMAPDCDNPANARFRSKIRRTHGCWEWIDKPNPRTGYARFNYRGRSQSAHRAAWEFAYGPIPDGLFVLHRCDNRICVRPDHLFLGTQADNLADCRAKGRRPPPWNKRLTEEQIAEIRARYAQGETQVGLGREFGVAHRTIGKLVNGRGKGWHITGAPSQQRKPCRGCGVPKLPGKGRKYCGRC